MKQLLSRELVGIHTQIRSHGRQTVGRPRNFPRSGERGYAKPHRIIANVVITAEIMYRCS